MKWTTVRSWYGEIWEGYDRWKRYANDPNPETSVNPQLYFYSIPHGRNGLRWALISKTRKVNLNLNALIVPKLHEMIVNAMDSSRVLLPSWMNLRFETKTDPGRMNWRGNNEITKEKSQPLESIVKECEKLLISLCSFIFLITFLCRNSYSIASLPIASKPSLRYIENIP